MEKVAKALAESFNEKYPDVSVDVQLGGSSTGIKNAQDGVSDIGNVSHVCPTLYLEVAPPGAPVHVHTEQALSVVDGPQAHLALHAAVRAMTGVALELLADRMLLKTVRDEFLQNRA